MSGLNADRIFRTARKIECLAAFDFKSSVLQISSIEQP
jgi:hypothetical protein